jgi:hypothetical protein
VPAGRRRPDTADPSHHLGRTHCRSHGPGTPLTVAVQMEAGLTANGWPGWSTPLPPPGFCHADLFEQRSPAGSEIEVRRCLGDHFCHRSGRVGRVEQQNVPSAAQGEQRLPHPFHGCDGVPALPASERLPSRSMTISSWSTDAAGFPSRRPPWFTGLDRVDFTTHQARRALTCLGTLCGSGSPARSAPSTGRGPTGRAWVACPRLDQYCVIRRR